MKRAGKHVGTTPPTVLFLIHVARLVPFSVIEETERDASYINALARVRLASLAVPASQFRH